MGNAHGEIEIELKAEALSKDSCIGKANMNVLSLIIHHIHQNCGIHVNVTPKSVCFPLSKVT